LNEILQVFLIEVIGIIIIIFIFITWNYKWELLDAREIVEEMSNYTWHLIGEEEWKGKLVSDLRKKVTILNKRIQILCEDAEEQNKEMEKLKSKLEILIEAVRLEPDIINLFKFLRREK